MTYILVSIVFFGMFFILMSLGLLQGKAIKGTCGGLNKFKTDDGRTICEACAPKEVEELKQKILSS
ncbi:MAG TPA: (Na+)-NQR maturation NqrM [Oligoflexia bacterium]|nr:(Na+)-NQR maturation NqrM [Oligoflexia bacterium]HMR24212.1 (Na+)-NQR maturation NqrM [Oligoflexia bacterium]